jgi:hypothetical protein
MVVYIVFLQFSGSVMIVLRLKTYTLLMSETQRHGEGCLFLKKKGSF